jgi:hypothetical protein
MCPRSCLSGRPTPGSGRGHSGASATGRNAIRPATPRRRPALAAQDKDVIDALEHTEKLSLQEKGAVLLIYAKGAPQPSRFTRVQ